jgi:hypothetical protein
MADLPDFIDFDKRALDDALHRLPVPGPCPPPPGFSIQDAIKVQHILKFRIAFDIVCDIAYEIVK